MKALFALLIGLGMAQAGPGTTNEPLTFRTNFVSGATLSTPELITVARLAHFCGIQKIAAVSTERHLSGTTILVVGDEKIEGRLAISKTLAIYPNSNRRVRPVDAPSDGDFWVQSAKPGRQELTIVRVGDHEMRVGLLNGIKPEAADKIITAFMKGRVQGATLAGVDVTQPSWMGISGGKFYIIFGSSPYERFTFKLDGDRVTMVEQVHMYE